MFDETGIRFEAIQYVLAVRGRWVGIPASELRAFRASTGEEIFLKSIQGVFKPSQLSSPLSITTTLQSPYADKPVDGNRVLYAFSPRSTENDGLKRCGENQTPLIYFLQTKPKPNPEYVVFAPVYVTDWNDASRMFLIDLSEHRLGGEASKLSPKPPFMLHTSTTSELGDLKKGYVMTTVQRRLHQARFRNQILEAYRGRCAVCVLRVRPLLDAAHVTPDRDPEPTIRVSDGIALCSLHHRAFDTRILTYDGNYRVQVDLPELFPVGDSERNMLLAFRGRELTLPTKIEWWPTIRP